MYYEGTVSIIGKPNVGKSTLLNRLVNQKVSITSKKPQTTRHEILGYAHGENYNVIYVDTPGMREHYSHALARLMNANASKYPAVSDLVLFVVNHKGIDTDDEIVLNLLKSNKVPVVLVVNMIDRIRPKDRLLPYLDKLKSLYAFCDIVPISARLNQNIDRLKKVILQYIPQAEKSVTTDAIFTQPPELSSFIPEIIREKIFRLTGDEIPYESAVLLQEMKEQDKLWYIDATIIVAKLNQKKIIIGSGGSKLKQIGMEARSDIERLLGKQVHLRLWVDVKPNWFEDPVILHTLKLM